MEYNQSHRSGANSTLYKVAMKVYPLSSHFFILASPVCFAVTNFPSTTLIYLSISTSEPSTKYETCRVI